MNFEVYCDESGLEALSLKEAHLYSAIGGIWLPEENRIDLKQGMKAIKDKYAIKGELKWQKISPSYFDLYKEIIDFFFQTEYIRFRVIMIESAKVDFMNFSNKDPELGFYKFYYQLLHHWIFDFNNYNIFVDLKINRDKDRLKELRNVLDLSNLTSGIPQVQGLPSEQSLGIQLADILTGLATSKFNNEIKQDSAKAALINHVEQTYIKKAIAPTPKWEEKFNVFKINLEGGW
jgi:hypothetical protein